MTTVNCGRTPLDAAPFYPDQTLGLSAPHGATVPCRTPRVHVGSIAHERGQGRRLVHGDTAAARVCDVPEKDGTMLIQEVFEQFLAEQQAQLAPKTYRNYASVLELFAHQLDGYGWNNIPDGTEAYEAAKKRGRSFIDLYDHTHIESNVREFLDYFGPPAANVRKFTVRLLDGGDDLYVPDSSSMSSGPPGPWYAPWCSTVACRAKYVPLGMT